MQGHLAASHFLLAAYALPRAVCWQLGRAGVKLMYFKRGQRSGGWRLFTGINRLFFAFCLKRLD